MHDLNGQCDEEKPSCNRCVSIGYTCSYTIDSDGAVSESMLESYYTGVFQVDLRTPLVESDARRTSSAPRYAQSSEASRAAAVEHKQNFQLPRVPVTVPELAGDISIFELECPPVYGPDLFYGLLVDTPSSFPAGTYGSVLERIGNKVIEPP